MVKHFLHITDFTADEIWETLNLAKELKVKFRQREDYKPFITGISEYSANSRMC